MVKKTMLMLSIFAIFLLASTAAAETWKQVAKDKDMKIGENFTTSEGFRAQLSDISTGDKESVLFDIFAGEVKQETIICYTGQTEKIFDDNYKVTLVDVVKGKPHCVFYKKSVPVFEIASSTTHGDKNKTIVYAKLTEMSATNIKVTWEVSGKDVNKPSSKNYGTLKHGTELKKTTIYWSGEAKIIMKITYKDVDGEAYTQAYDVVNNAVVSQAVEEVKPSTLTTTTTKISDAKLATEKNLLKKAITRALKYIDFSEESEADLNRIISEI